MEVFDKMHEATASDLIAQLRKSYPNMPEDKIKMEAEQVLFFWKSLASFSLLKLVTTSLAAPELEPIFEEIFGGDTAAVKLLDASLKMYLTKGFPDGLIGRLVRDFKGKPLPIGTLRLFAIEHFDQIYVPIPTRKSVCALLSIEYRVMALSGPKAER
jgi:hypothetical protein